MTRHVQDPLLGFWTTLVVGDRKELRRELSRRGCDPDSSDGVDAGACLTLGDDEGATAFVVWLPPPSDDAEDDLKTLEHEAMHASMRSLDRAGIPFSVDEPEALCHHATMLMGLWRKKLKRKGTTG